MIANLEALIALAEVGTMTRAATALRITQSAVSKRIAALEARLGLPLVEPDGRRVRLTADGTRLLQRAAPLVAELKSALMAEASEPAGVLVLGVSESIHRPIFRHLIAVAATPVVAGLHAGRHLLSPQGFKPLLGAITAVGPAGGQ